MAPSTDDKQTTVGLIQDEVLRYTAAEDIVLDLRLAEVDCLGTAAHVTMLARVPVQPKLLTPHDRDRVLEALAQLVTRIRAGAFAIRVEDQDVHMAVERELTAVLGDLGKRVHTARSRNDQVAVDLRLFTRDQLLGTIDETVSLASALLSFGRRHRTVPMVGRTHMQPAMPSSVGVWATAWVESLLEDVLLLETAYAINNRNPLGSAAGYGVPLPIDRHLTTRLLAFDDEVHNVLHASNARGKCEAIVLSALGQVMLTLSRLAQDLILYSMPEFGWFRLPPRMCTGSSIMPQKNNPDVLELVRARAARVQAAASGVLDMTRALPGGYNRDMQETKPLLFSGLDLTRDSLRILRPLVAGTEVDRAALRRGFTPAVYATDRALELVAGGMPFRDAYREVKASLDSLGQRDPSAAIAAKTHLGAAAGLDFGRYAGQLRAAARANGRRRAAVQKAFARLLGVT